MHGRMAGGTEWRLGRRTGGCGGKQEALWEGRRVRRIQGVAGG